MGRRQDDGCLRCLGTGRPKIYWNFLGSEIGILEVHGCFLGSIMPILAILRGHRYPPKLLSFLRISTRCLKTRETTHRPLETDHAALHNGHFSPKNVQLIPGITPWCNDRVGGRASFPFLFAPQRPRLNQIRSFGSSIGMKISMWQREWRKT